MNLKLMLAVILSIVGPAASAQSAPPETVVRVIDGDTLSIAGEWSPYNLHWTVRILGIDTPEKGRLAKCEREKLLSKEASALVASLLSRDRRVFLSQVKHDKYGGRINAVVYLMDGRSIADILIAAKLAKRYNGNGPKPSWCY